MSVELPESTKKITIKKGKRYSICTCGASDVMPFCDGKHRVLNEQGVCNYKSIKIISEKDTTVQVYSSAWDSWKNVNTIQGNYFILRYYCFNFNANSLLCVF